MNRFRCLGFLLFLSTAAHAAPPSWSHLYPSGASRGETSEITILDGKYARWPVEIWSSGDGLEVKAGEKKGRLEVTVAADARPGVRWLRLYDAEGASPPRPFFIGTLPEVVEKEPNDAVSDAVSAAQRLETTAVVVNGRLEKRGDVDSFALELEKGQTLVASMVAHRCLRSPMDGVLQIVSEDGFVLATNDDEHGFDPQIVFEPPEDGVYVVRTFAFPAQPNSSIQFSGDPKYVYRLTLTTGGFVDHTLPLAVTRGTPQPVEGIGWNIPAHAAQLGVPTDPFEARAEVAHGALGNTVFVRVTSSPSRVEAATCEGRTEPRRLELPCALSGRLEAPGEVDAFAFRAEKDQKLLLELEARSLGSPADPVITLLDSTGKKLAHVDDTGKRRDAELTHTFGAEGEYRVEIRDLHGRGGRRYVYLLTARAPQPDFELAVTSDRFTVKAGGSIEIPVTVNRKHGFNGAIDIDVLDLAATLRADPAVSEATGDSAKAVKLTVHAGKEAVSAPLQIRGTRRGAEAGSTGRLALAALKELDASVPHLWITVSPGD